MSRHAVTLGEIVHKAGRPGITWVVESLKPGFPIAHFVLTRVDDPTTKIAISADALSNPLYFSRPVAPS